MSALMSAFGGKADIICSRRVFPVLTQSGHRMCIGQHAVVHFRDTAVTMDTNNGPP
jgi:hypothetical protein